jgi:hypothetical protein
MFEDKNAAVLYRILFNHYLSCILFRGNCQDTTLALTQAFTTYLEWKGKVKLTMKERQGEREGREEDQLRSERGSTLKKETS